MNGQEAVLLMKDDSGLCTVDTKIIQLFSMNLYSHTTKHETVAKIQDKGARSGGEGQVMDL